MVVLFSFFRYIRERLHCVDDQTGGESSKSNSITSEHSIQSMGVSASSQSSSTNSLPPAVDNSSENTYSNIQISRNRHKVSSNVLLENHDHGLPTVFTTLFVLCTQPGNLAMAGEYNNVNNFATIRTTSIVTKQQKEHMQEEMHEQMSGYKRMRREHQAALFKVVNHFFS
jgi:thousand and one amino acid protein kinase